MSSKNRGTVTVENEVYPTPAWCVDRLLDKFALGGGRWLEPCAGDGAIIKAVNEYRAARDHARVTWDAVELRNVEPKIIFDGRYTAGTDFLKWAHDHRTRADRWSVAITNPPYSLACPIIERCLDMAEIVIMGPMRLAFLASDERWEWWYRVGIPDQYILPNRPDFSGLGGDSADYAWFVWDKPDVGVNAQGRHQLLDLTPAEVRLAQRPAGWEEARAKAKAEKEARARAKAEKLLSVQLGLQTAAAAVKGKPNG